MIAKMSKVEIAGPKGVLQDVLSLLRELGIFQVEPSTLGFIEKGDEAFVRSFALDEETVRERLYLEDLLVKIDELLSYLPKRELRTSAVEPESIIESLARTVESHIQQTRDLTARREAARKERADLERYTAFLGDIASLMESAQGAPDLEFIGLTIREPAMVGRLREAISRITDWKFELATDQAADGTLVGLITVEKDLAEQVKKALSDERVPEFAFPPAFDELSFPEKISHVKNRINETAAEEERITAELERFTERWLPLYGAGQGWIEERLSLLRTTASAFETRMCFFIYGWMPSRDLPGLRRRTERQFGSQVVIEEQDIREEELERVPIMLKNPAYFKPFEILTSFLPLPIYSSYDPTTFIGIFFPIFFGIILGDAGYGLVLAVVALILMKKMKRNALARDGGKILLISSFYVIFFGVLFGEFFGDLPERLFHVEPLCIERRTAIVPMLIFSLALGAAHVLLGLVLGAVNAFQRHIGKEGLYKLLSIVVIVGLAGVIASFFGYFPVILTRPIILAILFLSPFLFFTGGILAPLELLKSIGNIISYVRITAIGLTSVLLAFVANRLGGLTGDIVTGIVAAGLIHILNIILGVFSPTIHSLRLHYVEFFSKFIEHGGRRFEPLKR